MPSDPSWLDDDEAICSCCRARLPSIEMMGWSWRRSDGQVIEGLLCPDCEEELDVTGELVVSGSAEDASAPND